MVETIRMLSRKEREARAEAACFNLFNLRSGDVYIDLLTDSGTNAMSQEQWAGIMRGDEAYAGSGSYYRLIDAGRDIFGYGYIQPVHQGRAAEKILMPLLLAEKRIAISNMFFDTTRAHVHLAGGRTFDCITEAAKDPAAITHFKGNMDTDKLEKLIGEFGAEKIAFVIMTVTNNSAGGQPVSMKNLRQTAGICKKHGIPLVIDAARYAENAYFIKRDEEGYKAVSIGDIVQEMFGYGDMFMMSAKKDAIVNMGGLIGVKDEELPLVEKIKAGCVNYEGFYTYGGMNGRDLEAMATGLYEGIEEDYLAYRIGQMEYLGTLLDEAGIVYQSPVGGHGVFVDAAAMFPHVPYYEFPGQLLAVELYKEAGIRTCDVGSFMLGNDPDTGAQLRSDFEFTRLAVPRRVYTRAHLDIVADALAAIKKRSSEIRRGYNIVWEPPILRHFQARLEPISDV